MLPVCADLFQLRERFDGDIRRERYNRAALLQLRLHCGRVTAQLLALPYDGAVLNTELRTFTVLRLVWRIKRYLQAYNRIEPVQWGEVHELYELKHALLTHIICGPRNRWCLWELGQATDIRTAISVRLHYAGTAPWNTLVHWPMRHVPVCAQQVIRATTGSWPPPEYIDYAEKN